MFQINKSVFSVGTLNPNMRIFDIVMRTEYGTSYNSYLIKDEKIVLIDGCHERFSNSFINNIEEITPLNKIDYLVVNHCEPDHTGALKELITRVPNIEIFCTPSSKIFLNNIIKLPLKIHVVKDGEILNIGKQTLQFIVAPFLHWPDSMFTYLKESKIIFTCDFLGCHYCEPLMLDYKISYKDAYKKAVEEYYDAIFSSFRNYVKQGLEKIKSLELDYVCTSHGPILTKQGMYEYAYRYYWNACTKIKTKLSIPIVYASAYGYTAQIAQAIQEGILSCNAQIECPLLDVNAYNMDEIVDLLNKSIGFCIGSPTLNKNVVPPIAQVISKVDAINCKNKPVLIFGSFGWSGEAQNIMKAMCNTLQLKPYEANLHFCFSPTKEQLEETRLVAQKFGALLFRGPS